MGGEESVKVAVRCRPFNKREKTMGAKLCIDMNGPSTTIKDLSGKHADKTFTFDYSYWSHDGFHEDENGYQIKDSDKYSGQRDVFDSLGVLVLNNAFEGFNTSLFAYGQTGSGKSYSMVGYPPNVGIVPMAFDRLFSTIRENEDPNTTYQVTFSMLEVYMEAVADLIADPSSRKKGGLKVRQNPKLGRFYVEGLTKTAVTSYEQIDALTEKGTSNRTVAATKMNATSSRAHTVVTLVLTIKTVKDGQNMTKTSEINLVDLAGSERAGSTGATGDTLKEGAKINQSLSALGNVISALAEGKKAPFRDSKLTMLLQNALGGNSKTIMIAAVSPADVNYDESLSTLRYADRAKQIKTKAAVNESPTDKLIRELREANEMMKQQLEAAMKGMSIGGPGDGGGAAAKKMQQAMELQLRLQEEELAQLDGSAYQEQVDAQKLVEDSERRERQEKEAKLASTPHLSNMNEDPHLNGMMVYFLEAGTNRIGAVDKEAQKKKRAQKKARLRDTSESASSPTPGEDAAGDGGEAAAAAAEGAAVADEGAPADHEESEASEAGGNPYIELTGLGVILNHAEIVVGEDSSVTLVPNPEVVAQQPETMLVNGKPTLEPVQLKHHDRIRFGRSHLYLYKNPRDTETAEGTPDGDIAYEHAMEEIIANKPPVTHVYGLSEEVSALMDKLIPLVEQANEYTKELGKARQWHIKYMNPLFAGLDDGEPTVLVQMVNEDTGNEWFFDPGEFELRLYSMEQAYRNMDHIYGDGSDDDDDDSDDDDVFEEGHEDMFFDEKTNSMKTRPRTSKPRSRQAPEAEADPFSHGTADVVVGTVKIPLDGIAYNQADDDDFFIKDHSERSRGTLEVSVQPCDKDRNPIEEFRENPDELEGQELYFQVNLKEAHMKDPKSTKGMKIVYAHEHLGGHKVWAEGAPSVDKHGFEIPGAVTFNSSEVLGMATVGRSELSWLLEGAELTAIVLKRQTDDAAQIAEQAAASETMSDTVAKITDAVGLYRKDGGSAAEVVKTIAAVLGKDGDGEDGTWPVDVVDALQSDIKTLQAKIDTLTGEIDKVTKEAGACRIEAEGAKALRAELDALKEAGATGGASGERTNATSTEAAAPEPAGAAPAPGAVEDLEARVAALESERDALAKKLAAAEGKVAALSKSAGDAEKLKGDLDSKDASVKKLQGELGQKDTQIERLETEAAAARAQLTAKPKSKACVVM